LVEFEDVAKLLDLGGGERPIAARGEVEFEEADLHAAELFDQLAEMLEHHADLVLAPLGEADLIPGILAGLDELDVRGGGAAAVQRDAVGERRDLFVREVAVHFYDIRFDNVAGGRGDSVSELAIIGEDEQAFAGIIEPTDGEDAFLHAAQQVHDGLASFRIGDGGDALARFVERDVDVGARGF